MLNFRHSKSNFPLSTVRTTQAPARHPFGNRLATAQATAIRTMLPHQSVPVSNGQTPTLPERNRSASRQSGQRRPAAVSRNRFVHAPAHHSREAAAAPRVRQAENAHATRGQSIGGRNAASRNCLTIYIRVCRKLN